MVGRKGAWSVLFWIIRPIPAVLSQSSWKNRCACWHSAVRENIGNSCQILEIHCQSCGYTLKYNYHVSCLQICFTIWNKWVKSERKNFPRKFRSSLIYLKLQLSSNWEILAIFCYRFNLCRHDAKSLIYDFYSLKEPYKGYYNFTDKKPEIREFKEFDQLSYSS